MVALALLVVAIGGGISLWRKVADQKPIDQGPASAYLKRRRAPSRQELTKQNKTRAGEPFIASMRAEKNFNLNDFMKMKTFTNRKKLNLSNTIVNATAIDYNGDIKSLKWLDLNSANIGDGVTGLLG